MASFGKVLDLLDDRYLDLQDVVGNVEQPPTLVPYENYAQSVHVYRMDTSHDIFMGLVQDLTMRQAHETGKELWTWLVQCEAENNLSMRQPSSPKKARLGVQHACTPSNAPVTPRQKPALTIFERRTLDGALMLEEDMLRILIDIVQVASSLVPNFVEFLYRWIDYYEGDGKALKAALRWEIPSLWDFDYHPLVLPQEEVNGGDKQSASIVTGRRQSDRTEKATAELQQSSPTKKMQARTKPDLSTIELRTIYTEESERLQYREVKFGIQPPKLEQPLPPLINIPRDHRKRTKYYAACFRSRQRALFLLMEAGVTMRQINNYQKLQNAHPKETPEIGHENGLRNYQKDANFAQALFELKEKRTKQREIAISNKLAGEAEFAATHAVPDGAAGLPLIPPTPLYSRTTNMEAAMMRRIRETRWRNNEKIHVVPGRLVGRLKSKVFERVRHEPQPLLAWNLNTRPEWDTSYQTDADDNLDEKLEAASGSSYGAVRGTDSHDTAIISAIALSRPCAPLPRLLPLHLPLQLPSRTVIQAPTESNSDSRQSEPPNVSTYMQNLDLERARRLLPLLTPQARQAAASSLRHNRPPQDSLSSGLSSLSTKSVSLSTSGHNGPMVYQNEAATSPYASHLQSSFLPPVTISQGFGITEFGSEHQTAATVNSKDSHGLQDQAATNLPTSLPDQTSSEALLSPLRPSIARNAPSPLSLSPANASSFTTLGPQVLATSPFLDQTAIGAPIQIYLPKVLIPGNREGLGGIHMGNGGCVETDALLLGHEDVKTGELVLSKAILLPVGVWENTLRKVRSDRWSVLETYACPSSRSTKAHTTRNPPVVLSVTGCHKAAYDKLVQMYAMIDTTPVGRESEMTKRWRVSRGPMTSSDRGAVWEGWGVYVDRDVVMSAIERMDALRTEDKRSASNGGIHVRRMSGSSGVTFEAERRRLEMEALVDEDEDTDDELGMQPS